MDGFHLSNLVLKTLSRDGRKGAPDTFDNRGFISLLKRIRDEKEVNIYFPIFDRSIEESISAQGVIKPQTRLIITEGNAEKVITTKFSADVIVTGNRPWDV